MIKAAERPLIFAGGGVILSKGSEQLTRLAHMQKFP
jgi:acetolactate synthase-1/2/3 large subunit